MNLNLLPYQQRAKDFILTHKRCALHMDMGTGKTATTLAACAELLDTFDVRGVMVFAPLRVATIAWPEEIKKWTQFKRLSYCLVRGSESQRIKLLRTPSSIYLLNYELMTWWIAWLASEIKLHHGICTDMIILDESSRLKSASSSRFKSLKPLADSKLFPRIVELTGTPCPESYEDLFSQYRLLDGGQRLQRFVTHFRSRYFIQNPWNQYDWKLRPGADKEIQSKISDITITIRAEDYLSLPKLMENDIYVDLPASSRSVYNDFRDEMVSILENEAVAAPSAAQVSEKCRQVVSGGVYNKAGETIHLHAEKFDALDELLESSPGNLLVCYWYRHEFDTIRKRYPKAPVLGPKASQAEALRVVQEWNKGGVPLLFMHPSSVGHGINLQAGGNQLLWLTIPWSNEIYQQSIGRLHRMGQTKPVMVHRILMRGTIDVLVDKAVKGKEFSQRELRAELAKIR